MSRYTYYTSNGATPIATWEDQWNKGEPSAKGDRCVTMTNVKDGVYRWNDNGCKEKYSSICEKEGRCYYFIAAFPYLKD